MTLNHAYGWSEETPQSWLDLGVPEVQDYLTDICTEIVSKYDVDGLNLDYIRYREGGFGYNPISLQRFQKRYNRTDRPASSDEQWNSWRREQVTNLVRRIFVETKKIRPAIKLSACTIVWGSITKGYENLPAYKDVAQDWVGWLNEGIIDINIPMNYKREENPEQQKDYRRWVEFMTEHKHGKIGVSGVGAYLNSIQQTIDQIKAARDLGAQGSCIFRLLVNNKDNLPWQNLLTALKESLYIDPTAVPAFVPFDKRDTGIFCGTITKNKQTLDGVKLTLTADNGTTYSTLSDGSGFYAFCNISEGKYTLKSDDYLDIKGTYSIKKGKIETADFKLKI